MSGPRDILHAMASGSALAVVGVLVDGPRTIQQIADVAHLSPSRIQRVLAGLRPAGVVSREAAGVVSRDDGRPGRLPHIYRLEPDALAYLARWLGALAKHARQHA